MLDEYISELKDLVDGYVLGPTGMYEGKSFLCESYKSDNITDIVEHIRDSHEKVFLYAISLSHLETYHDYNPNLIVVRYHGVK